MTSIQLFKVQLFLDKSYYLGGEVINGTVKLILNRPVACKRDGLIIKFTGYSKTYIERREEYPDANGKLNSPKMFFLLRISKKYVQVSLR